MLRYLDDWVVISSSRTDALWARDEVLSLSRPWDCRQSPQVSSGSSPVRHLPGHISHVSDFEGFSLSGEGFRPADSYRRISVLQAAKRRLLV